MSWIGTSHKNIFKNVEKLFMLYSSRSGNFLSFYIFEKDCDTRPQLECASSMRIEVASQQKCSFDKLASIITHLWDAMFHRWFVRRFFKKAWIEFHLYPQRMIWVKDVIRLWRHRWNQFCLASYPRLNRSMGFELSKLSNWPERRCW